LTRQQLRENLNCRDTDYVLKNVIKVINGWIAYNAISDNQRRISEFIKQSKRIIFWWFNRRGGKRYVPWAIIEEKLTALDFPKGWETVSMFLTH
jgi:hypothetical protein